MFFVFLYEYVESAKQQTRVFILTTYHTACNGYQPAELCAFLYPKFNVVVSIIMVTYLGIYMYVSNTLHVKVLVLS